MRISDEQLEQLKWPRTAICTRDVPESWDPFPQWEPSNIKLSDLLADIADLKAALEAKIFKKD